MMLEKDPSKRPDIQVVKSHSEFLNNHFYTNQPYYSPDSMRELDRKMSDIVMVDSQQQSTTQNQLQISNDSNPNYLTDFAIKPIQAGKSISLTLNDCEEGDSPEIINEATDDF